MDEREGERGERGREREGGREGGGRDERGEGGGGGERGICEREEHGKHITMSISLRAMEESIGKTEGLIVNKATSSQFIVAEI